jgi:hypothetical protein
MASNRKHKSKPARKSAIAPQDERAAARRGAEEVDACDFKLLEAEATPDEDLPAAEGGVA